jgi:hypothetical protein
MTVPATASSTYTVGGHVVRSPAELRAIAELGDEARALLKPDTKSPRAFFSLLLENGLHADAVRYLAHALPRREAVWWAWACARKSAGAEPPPPIKAALDATEQWIVQPTEENRRKAFQVGEAADFGTAAGCAALGAFMSGGSMAPADAPVVPPGEFICAKAVSGGVTLAVVGKEPERAAEKFKEYLQLGLEVAERTKLWPAGS